MKFKHLEISIFLGSLPRKSLNASSNDVAFEVSISIVDRSTEDPIANCCSVFGLNFKDPYIFDLVYANALENLRSVKPELSIMVTVVFDPYGVANTGAKSIATSPISVISMVTFLIPTSRVGIIPTSDLVVAFLGTLYLTVPVDRS